MMMASAGTDRRRGLSMECDMKKIRLEISEEDFGRLYQESTEGSTLRRILDKKIDDMTKRELYTSSKCDPSEAEREAARRSYLDMIGVPDSFRW